jgi:hypothetical protein
VEVIHVGIIERERSSIYWAHLSRFHGKEETESSLLNVVIRKKGWWILSGIVIVLFVLILREERRWRVVEIVKCW